MKYLIVCFRGGPNVAESPHKDSITGMCVCSSSCRHVVCQHGCRACLMGIWCLRDHRIT